MIQGTASHVGKSVLVAALCRIFVQDGYRVAPFKSQNMALNSFVTKDGGEMGRAQVVQAEAACIEPTVDMNPILLKPTGNASSQVVVLGKPVGNFSARQYHLDYATGALRIIGEALNRLRQAYDIVVIEGAGSPAEINLQEHEIVNMRIARMAGAPVLLVADIDKGGALASVVGTLELVSDQDRARIAGFVINKFRGDLNLFQPAVDFLEQKTGRAVFGVVPYFQEFRIQEEDTIPSDRSPSLNLTGHECLDIAVIRLPHIANFTDFDPLEDEPDVRLSYAVRGNQLEKPDLIIIPGSKNTIEDLYFLQRSGLADRIADLSNSGTPVIGICGGFQMLGSELNDPLHAESTISRIDGLQLLNISTTFYSEKVTTRVRAVVSGAGSLLTGTEGNEITGYEIHMGKTELAPDVCPAFRIVESSGREVNTPDGAVSRDGLVFGTYIHGIFDNHRFRRQVLNNLRAKKGFMPLALAASIPAATQRNKDLDKLAALVRSSLDMKKIYVVMGIK